MSATNVSPTRPDAFDLATRIAAEMADPWAAVRMDDMMNSHEYARIRRADGLEVSVTTRRYDARGRLVFRGIYPSYEGGQQYGGGRSYEMTCALDKSPRQLAVEIERRLLSGGFDQAWKEARNYVDRADLHLKEAQAAAARIARSVGADEPRKGRQGDAIRVGVPIESVLQLKVQPASGAAAEDARARPAVSFEVYAISEATALRVLAILKEAGGAK